MIFFSVRSLLVAFVSLPGIALALPEWVTSHVDNKVSVQAPAALAEVDILGILKAQGASSEQLHQFEHMKVFTAKDAGGTYLVLRLEQPTPPTGGAPQPIKTADRTLFYDGMVSALLQDEQGVLLQRTGFSVAGLDGVDITYRGLLKGTGKKVLKYNRCILVDQVGYALTYLPADPQDSTDVNSQSQRRRFFGSLVLKPDQPR